MLVGVVAADDDAVEGGIATLGTVVEQLGLVLEDQEPGPGDELRECLRLAGFQRGSPTWGCWLSTSTPVVGSMPSWSSARTRVPCPAEPTLVETFWPLRSVTLRAAESGGTTTMLSAPVGL